MVHEARSGREQLFKSSGGGEVVNGSLFHGMVVKPVLESLARGHDARLEAILRRDPVDAEELWQDLDRRYLQPCVQFSDALGNNPAEQILVFSQGLKALAVLIARLVDSRRPLAEVGAELPPIFMMPEQSLQRSMDVAGVGRVYLSGRYDGLFFDLEKGHLSILEFKCRPDAEMVGDFTQLAAYAWMISQRSGVPVGGILIYVQAQTLTREFTPQELQEVFPASERLLRKVAHWLNPDRVNQLHPIPPTTVAGLCARCPVEPVCESTFGPRH